MTTPTNATVNGSRAVSVRLVTPYRGVWFADVDLDPEDATQAPSGAVTLSIGTTTLKGTVDPRGSGRFVDKVHLRIVGGGNGWDQPARAQHFHNDSGVNSTQVFQSTASSVGETVNVSTPTSLGVDFVRSSGPASQVLADVDWYVDLGGVTQVASRPAATPDPSLEVLAFDANMMALEVTSDVVVLPGTTFTDKRFDGTLTARDVEQTFDTSGSRATVFCSTAPVTRLASALENMVREFSGVKYLKAYRYRFISANASRVNLQAVTKEPGLPDLLPLSVWPGMAGLSAKLAGGATVLVVFIEGDKSQPVVVGFDGTLPQELHLDASDVVVLQGGTKPAAGTGDGVQVFFPPAVPVAGTITIAGVPSPFVGVLTIPTPAPGVIIGGSPKVLV